MTVFDFSSQLVKASGNTSSAYPTSADLDAKDAGLPTPAQLNAAKRELEACTGLVLELASELESCRERILELSADASFVPANADVLKATRRIAARILRRAQWAALLSWASWALHARCQRVKQRRAALRLSRGLVTAALGSWAANAASQRRQARIATKVVLRMKMKYGSLAIDTWKARVVEEAQLRRVTTKALQRMLHKRLAMATGRWVENVTELRRQRQVLTKIVMRMKMKYGSLALASWKLLVEEELGMKTIKSLKDTLEAEGLECGRLRQLVRDMVPKERLEAQAASSKASQGNRERSAVQHDQAARDELRISSREVDQLRMEIARQHQIIESLETRARLAASEEAEAEVGVPI